LIDRSIPNDIIRRVSDRNYESHSISARHLAQVPIAHYVHYKPARDRFNLREKESTYTPCFSDTPSHKSSNLPQQLAESLPLIRWQFVGEFRQTFCRENLIAAGAIGHLARETASRTGQSTGQS